MAKKPWNIVASCIAAFSKPGEVVVDPFVGCGITAGEALRLKRRIIATDLCPLSVFITRMTVTPYTSQELGNYDRAVSALIANLWNRVDWAYQTTCKSCGANATALEFAYDSLNDQEDPRQREWSLNQVRFRCKKNPKHEDWKKAEKSDRDLLEKVNHEKPSHIVPQTRFLTNTRINIYDGMTVSDIFTPRASLVLSEIRYAIFNLKSEKTRELAKFALSCTLHLARMSHSRRANFQNFFIPKRDMRELNVLAEFSTKSSEASAGKLKMSEALSSSKVTTSVEKVLSGEATAFVGQWDATKLGDLVPESSVHYVHTDPPYVDQVPYLEVSLPYVSWLQLATETEYREKLNSEIILTNSPERPHQKHKTPEGMETYRNLLGESMSQVSFVLAKNRWASIWFCSQDEDAWRALSDNIKMNGLEDRTHNLVVRAIKTFKVNIEKERNPLARVLEQDLLLHAIKTGVKGVPQRVPLNVALELFRDVALREISKKGYATTGEIYLSFVKECFDKYKEPPPDTDYLVNLTTDPRFVAEERKELVKDKFEKVTAWRLHGNSDKNRLSSYME
jgi:hypothetical protein